MIAFHHREAVGIIFKENGKYGGAFSVPLDVRLRPEFSADEIQQKMEFIVDKILEKFQELNGNP